MELIVSVKSCVWQPDISVGLGRNFFKKLALLKGRSLPWTRLHQAG